MATRNLSLWSRHLALALAVALTAGASFSATSATAQDAPCGTVAAKHLEDLNVPPADIKDIAVVRILNNPEFGSVLELQAWASLRSCSGNVVVKLTHFCRVKETYTRGGCRLDNIKHF